MNISLVDYTKISAKGRAAGKRVTTYQVDTESLEKALEKASRTHLRRIADGDLAPQTRQGGYARSYGQADYQIL
jgi:hypothetical protein